jgi:hypothetical protein
MTALARRQFAGCVAAFLFAALAAAALATALGGSIDLLPYAFAVAIAHAVLLGQPVFVVFYRKGWVNAVTCTGGGAAIGALPCGLFAWPWNPGSGFSSWSHNTPKIIDGVPTAAGWLEYAELTGMFALHGALAGLVFWLVLKLSVAPKVTGESQGRASRWQRRAPAVSLVMALVLIAGVIAVPALTKDRTCHNMFRDGRQSIVPQVNIDLRIEKDDWSRLAAVLSTFSAANGMHFRDSTRIEPAMHYLHLSACNDHGVNIHVHDMRWTHRNFEPLIAGRGVPVGVYEVHDNSGWPRIAGALIADLEVAWPGKVAFLDQRGNEIPVPQYLRDANAHPARPGPER